MEEDFQARWFDRRAFLFRFKRPMQLCSSDAIPGNKYSMAPAEKTVSKEEDASWVRPLVKIAPEPTRTAKEARIMIVEDEGIIARSLKDELEDMGYQVPAVVARGEEVLEKAREVQPDLALIDIYLEGEMDGIAVAKQLRAELGLPAVFLTAYSDRETLERSKAAEPLGYLIKPVHARDLLTALELALSRHAQEKTRQQEGAETLELSLNLDQALEQTEILVVKGALERTGGNVAGAARLLETNRPRIYRILKRMKEQEEG